GRVVADRPGGQALVQGVVHPFGAFRSGDGPVAQAGLAAHRVVGVGDGLVTGVGDGDDPSGVVVAGGRGALVRVGGGGLPAADVVSVVPVGAGRVGEPGELAFAVVGVGGGEVGRAGVGAEVLAQGHGALRRVGDGRGGCATGRRDGVGAVAGVRG